MKSEEILEPHSEITRRTFCNRVLLSSVGLGLAANNLSGQTLKGQTPSVAYPPQKIEGGETLLPGAFLYFSYPTPHDPAVLVRTQHGEFLAYSRKCAHLGCSVEFDRQQRCLTCPCHQGAYDPRTGYVMYGPPPQPLEQIMLQMRRGSEVWAVGKTSVSTSSNA